MTSLINSEFTKDNILSAIGNLAAQEKARLAATG